MPWNERNPPPAMRSLPDPVLTKAVAIANALLREGHDEGFAIRVGISRAWEWFDARAQPRSPRDVF